MNRITLTATGKGWMARFEGNKAAEIIRLFGTDTLPTAFTAEARIADVAAFIARSNPDSQVWAETMNGRVQFA